MSLTYDAFIIAARRDDTIAAMYQHYCDTYDHGDYPPQSFDDFLDNCFQRCWFDHQFVGDYNCVDLDSTASDYIYRLVVDIAAIAEPDCIFPYWMQELQPQCA